MAKRILTVDDSKTMRDMVAFTLRKAGFDVNEAEDGQKALTVLSGAKFDLIITDLNMPNMDGICVDQERPRQFDASRRADPDPHHRGRRHQESRRQGGGRDRVAGQTVQPGQARRTRQARVSVTGDPAVDHLEQFRKTYFEECAELLDALQSHLDLLSSGGGDEETMHAIFRAVHSIKGGAGAFGFTKLVSFSHIFESLLDAMRDRKVAATKEVIQLLLRASDALADIVSAAQSDQPLPDDFAADIAAALEDALSQRSDGAAPKAQPAAAAPDRAEVTGERRYQISFQAARRNVAKGQ